MSDPLGRHYCSLAEDLDDFGYAFCPLLQRRIRCLGLDEDCEHREMKMKYKVLTRQFDDIRPDKQFAICDLEAKDAEEAWEIIETELINSNIQAWLLTEVEFKTLKKIINKIK